MGDPGREGALGPAGEMGTPGSMGDAGWPCWELDGDPACDVSEDINGDGLCDVWDCRGGQRGVLFTRWGRDDCPGDTTLVYAGFAAGGSYNHSGGTSSTLCLSAEPTWDDYSDADENPSLLYGVEYETGVVGMVSLQQLHNEDALCAVCLDTDANLQLMVPGTQVCPAGWNSRYQGYLMGGQYNEARNTELVCVDREPEGRPGGSANDNGALWYPTEAECGSLPCGGETYVQNREVTCSVCTL